MKDMSQNKRSVKQVKTGRWGSRDSRSGGFLSSERGVASLEDKIKELSKSERKKVSDFVNSLIRENGAKKTRRLLQGSLRHLDVDLSFEDIKNARQETWSKFSDKGED